jgi:hypothetical protein
MNKIEHQFDSFVRSVELGLKRADSFEQMLFDRGSNQAFDSAVGGGRRRAGNDHQAHSARCARFAIVRIRMSALLTKNHFYKATCDLLRMFNRPRTGSCAGASHSPIGGTSGA